MVSLFAVTYKNPNKSFRYALWNLSSQSVFYDAQKLGMNEWPKHGRLRKFWSFFSSIRDIIQFFVELREIPNAYRFCLLPCEGILLFISSLAIVSGKLVIRASNAAWLPQYIFILFCELLFFHQFGHVSSAGTSAWYIVFSFSSWQNI